MENENGKPFDTKFITNSILHVAIAVEYLQKHHLAHNDIKPDNVFVDKWGYAHLGDFGFVRQMNAETRTVWARDLGIKYRDYLAYPMPFYDQVDLIKVENENGKQFDTEITTNSILHENALEYLHKHHLAHNDISPENVFVDSGATPTWETLGLSGR
ncbi:protein kinase [Elysia marginata]|uniref:non-specific serine/threonine protein kinase n=1 Tax=Elysia marginata TaxID=1093978 RepID=A0AAV4HWZ9_9GAST|nr:protein kinase [Elysia marginata]